MGLRHALHATALVALASAPVLAAPPVAPPPKVAPARAVEPVAAEPSLAGPASAPWLVEVKAKNAPPASALRWQVYVKNRDGDYVLGVGKVQTRTVAVEKAFLLAGPPGEYLVLCSFQKGQEFIELEWKGRLTGGVEPVPVPPEPKPDDPPKPPEPKPQPDALKSFRVIFIYESGMNLTPDQRAVVYGAAVENWMTANCTDGAKGWRRRDKDAPGDADPTMKALWDAVKPNVTATPCVAMERNGKVEIVALEATPAKMIEKLTAYRGK